MGEDFVLAAMTIKLEKLAETIDYQSKTLGQHNKILQKLVNRVKTLEQRLDDLASKKEA